MAKKKTKPLVDVQGLKVPWHSQIMACCHDLGLPVVGTTAADIALNICEKYGWAYTSKHEVIHLRTSQILKERGTLRVHKLAGRMPAKKPKFVYRGNVVPIEARKCATPIPKMGEPHPEYVRDPEFYKSQEWRQLRYLAMKNTDGRCQCCGASQKEGVTLHVDHVLPRYKRPDLSLSLDNLQVLCEDCNIGKGAWDDTDWRVKM